jgi:hypothetical protein
MRTDLAKEFPADFEERLINDAALGAWPLRHAVLRSKTIEVGGS